MSGGRLVRGAGAILLILATVVLGRLIAITAPVTGDSRPWIYRGVMNEPVAESNFALTVLSVRGGRSLDGGFETQTTDGIFLLVRVRAVALKIPTAIKHAEVVDGAGNAYEAAYFAGIHDFSLHPGIPIEGDLLFEIPPAAATQLALRASSKQSYAPEHQTMVEVPLEIDADDVDAWYGEADRLTVLEPEVVG